MCLFCHDGTGASTDINLGEDSFGGRSGHQLENIFDTPETTDRTNACSSCHTPHGDPALRPKLPARMVNSVAIDAAGPAWCLACHNDTNDWYEGIGEYPPLAEPSLDASGYPTAGVFAGSSVYTNPAANAHFDIPASTEPTRTAGDCLYCHNAHGSASKYDSLREALAPSTAASVTEDRLTGAYAELCFGCHDGSTPAENIKQYATYGALDESLFASGGHRIKSAGGTLPVNAPLPCYNCHNPHGSSRGNALLLSDALGGDLNTRTGNPESVREFCLTCHVTSDLLGWDSEAQEYSSVSPTAMVEGLLRNGGAFGSGPDGGSNWLRLKVTPGHQSADTTSCYECHGENYDLAESSNVHNPGSYSVALHTGSPADDTITILGTPYGPYACESCHSLELGAEHAKATSSSSADTCGACHPMPRQSLVPSWDRDTCSQDGCHTAGGVPEWHAEADAGHAAPAVTCTTANCHSASEGLATLHVGASTTVAGEVRTSCDVCHADGVPATNDCETCHTGTVHPDADHTVAGPCSTSGCHGTEADLIHEAGPGCAACHATGVTPSLACGSCHATPHLAVNHGNAGACGGEYGSCHDAGNVMGVHGDNCASCHPTPAEGLTYDGGCEQAGCHAAPHASIAGYAVGHNAEHGDGNDCWSCHEGDDADGINDGMGIDSCTTRDGSAGGCHPHVYERVPPVTVSNAAASYTNPTTIILTATDEGFYGGWPPAQWYISGVRQTYYQVNGGPLQTGTLVSVLPPASGTVTKTIEFWSIDNNYNIEPHKFVSFTISAGGAPDTEPPTGTMSINNGAAAANTVAVTVTSSVTDPGSGVAQMRIDPGTGTYGGWITYAASYPITLPAGSGTKTVWVEYKDTSENVLALSDTIILDTVAPTGTISINAGAAWTNTTASTLTLGASDVGGSGVSQMRFSNNGVTWSAWEAYAPSKSWALNSGAGLKRAYVQFQDGAGNDSTTFNDTITLEVTAPAGTMSVNADAVYATSTAATLNSAVTDAGSGMGQMSVDPGDGTYGPWIAYNATHAFTLAGGDGLKTVRAEYRDNAGNVLSRSDTVTLDTAAPTGTMVVAGDVAMTPVASVSVDSAMSDATSGVYQMRIDPGSGTYGPWIAYAATQAITLSGSDGLKTVNVQYSDNAGLIATLTDTIVLDAGAPDTIPPTGAITINGAVAYTTSTAATLILSASDTGGSGLAEMRFSNDDSTWSAWEPYAPTTSWSLSAGDGAKTVYAQFRDGAGNASISYSDGITLDTTAPTGTIVIDGGAASTTTTSVSLALNADDSVGSGLAEMRFSNDDTTWSAWEAYAANKGWSLSAGEGAKTVYVQFRDVLGNTSGSFSDGITLVAPAATGTITFMWNAPDWGDPWADYYIYDYDGNLVHQASSSDIPGWYGWYTATVPVDSRPYSWHTEWYDPDFPEWDPGITDGTALIDYAGKAESYYY